MQNNWGQLNIRVYGLFYHPVKKALLISQEIIQGKEYTKLPGGGLEYGEGLKQALQREIREELKIAIDDVEHFYTCDFFQASFFHTIPTQIISVYYWVRFKNWQELEIRVAEQNAVGRTAEKKEDFQWLPLTQMHEDVFSLPIDKVVIQKLQDFLSHKKEKK